MQRAMTSISGMGDMRKLILGNHWGREIPLRNALSRGASHRQPYTVG